MDIKWTPMDRQMDMDDGQADGHQMDTSVVHLEREWMTRDQIAEKLGITQRTVSRRINRGEIEKKMVNDEARYRVSIDGQMDRTGVHRGVSKTPMDMDRTGQVSIDGQGGTGQVSIGEIRSKLRESRKEVEHLKGELKSAREERDAARLERDRAKYKIESLEDAITRMKQEEESRKVLFRVGPLEVSWKS